MTRAKLADATMQMRLRQFVVAGRQIPSEKTPEPTVYRMKIFARDAVIAKSRFWYFMKRLQRVKKSHGEVLEVSVVKDKKEYKARNYAVWLRYDSRTGTHNMYKEYRDVSKEGAVSQMYSEMAGRHRADACSIQIIDVKEIAADQCRRGHMNQILSNAKFPQIAQLPMGPKQLQRRFAANRPSTFVA